LSTDAPATAALVRGQPHLGATLALPQPGNCASSIIWGRAKMSVPAAAGAQRLLRTFGRETS